MKPYSAIHTAADGQAYSVRYLLDDAELAGLQAAGLVPLNAAEVVGMQDAADSLVAGLQKQLYTAMGGVMQ